MTAGWIVIAVVLLAALVGAASVMGSPVLAIPIVAVGLIAWGVVVVVQRGRRGAPLRDERQEDIEFTQRDRQTLLPSRGEPPEHAAEEARRRSEER